ncbi:hypothetical protein BTA51_18075 [Hahella sp. CCB-MM4]|uniref:CHAD domain-containing protein n=1 Tax=Hahella sp. (strain CCB-MM4) TaxID=1926491 RepID=UPI000B9B6A7C|nr:CHAD domain-containing protein [Hahella sp. CCB-MM4]OZG71915.1 hypothetical protein BTA51_18075 [Hahella sp. CCB-MM4]
MKRSKHLPPRLLEHHFIQRNDKLLITLLRTSINFDASVHQARKLLKEIRAFLRMSKPLTGNRATDYHQYLRQLATDLGQFRDQYVLQSVWQSFQSHLPERLALPPLPRELIRPECSLGTDPETPEEFISRLIDITHQLLLRSEPVQISLQHSDIDYPWAMKRYRWLYLRGRKAHSKANQTPSAPLYHDLRKCLKDEMYCLRLVKPGWNEFIRKRHKRLKQTTERLGQANDLDLLLETFHTNASTETARLLQLIRNRQTRQWAKAEKELSRLLCYTPEEYGDYFPSLIEINTHC